MFGWILVILGIGAVVARNDPNTETPITVGLGVVVTPADGWYSATDEWEVGDSGIALQKSGVYVAFWVDKYRGTNEDLLASVSDELSPFFESFRQLESQPVTIAGDLEGLIARFSGITDAGYEEDLLAVLAYDGTGVVMLAESLPGQMRWAQGDIYFMLRNIEVPR